MPRWSTWRQFGCKIGSKSNRNRHMSMQKRSFWLVSLFISFWKGSVQYFLVLWRSLILCIVADGWLIINRNFYPLDAVQELMTFQRVWTSLSNFGDSITQIKQTALFFMKMICPIKKENVQENGQWQTLPSLETPQSMTAILK